MGNYFDKYDSPDPVPTPAAPRAPAAGVSHFDKYDNPPQPAPLPPGGIDWSQLNKPVGELRAASFSPSQRATYGAQDALIAAGVEPYRAKHLAEGATGIAGLTPLGPALSAADLPYDVSRGNYGRAAFDVLGAAPGALAARRFVQGAPRIPMADAPIGRRDESFLPQRGWPDPYGLSPGGTVGPRATPAPYDELQQAARQSYQRIANNPIEYHPQVADHFVMGAQNYLASPAAGGFTPYKTPGIYGTLDNFTKQMRAHGGNITASDFDTLRQQLRGFDGAEGVAGKRAIDAIDAYMAHPPPGAMVAGTRNDLDTLRNDFAQARGDYRAFKTGETVDKAIDRAGTRTDVANSGLNLDNTTRQALAKFSTTNAGEQAIFGATPAERAAIQNVARGDLVGDKLRLWGNRLGGGGGWGQAFVGSMGGGLSGGAAHMLGLDPATSMALGTAGAVGPVMLGSGLRRAANERTVRAAEGVVDQIRQNSPLYQARAAAQPPIADPLAMQRDAVAYALVPQIAKTGANVWDSAHAPYEEQP